MERRLHADLHETQTGSGRERERERGARPGPAQRASERASVPGRRRAAGRRGCWGGGICASKRTRRAKFGWGLAFPSWRRHPNSYPVRKPKLSSATPSLAAAASDPRPGPLLPRAAALRPLASPPSFFPPWELLGAQGGAPSPAGCSAAARPGAPASSPRVETKFGWPRPAPEELPSAPPASRRAQPRRGRPSPPARPSQPCRPSCPSRPRS